MRPMCIISSEQTRHREYNQTENKHKFSRGYNTIRIEYLSGFVFLPMFSFYPVYFLEVVLVEE